MWFWLSPQNKRVLIAVGDRRVEPISRGSGVVLAGFGETRCIREAVTTRAQPNGGSLSFATSVAPQEWGLDRPTLYASPAG